MSVWVPVCGDSFAHHLKVTWANVLNSEGWNEPPTVKSSAFRYQANCNLLANCLGWLLDQFRQRSFRLFQGLKPAVRAMGLHKISAPQQKREKSLPSDADGPKRNPDDAKNSGAICRKTCHYRMSPSINHLGRMHILWRPRCASIPGFQACMTEYFVNPSEFWCSYRG